LDLRAAPWFPGKKDYGLCVLNRSNKEEYSFEYLKIVKPRPMHLKMSKDIVAGYLGCPDA
jgi:hypothetical protein